MRPWKLGNLETWIAYFLYESPWIENGKFGIVITLNGNLFAILSRKMRKTLLFPILMVVLIALVFMSNFLALKSTAVPLSRPQLDFIALDQYSSLEAELKKAKIELHELKLQVDQLHSQLTSCNDRNLRSEHKPEAAPAEPEEGQKETKPEQRKQNQQEHRHQQSKPAASAYCALFPHPIPSTIDVWNSMLDKIVEASRHELDRRWVLHDFTAQLLHLVSPDRLARSTMSLPHDWTPVQKVLKLLYKRHSYVTNQKNGGATPPLHLQPRKLKILVMGGSLIVGVNCRKIVKAHKLDMLMPNRLCTWTHRLESFLNKMFGGDYVEVHKIALGGTNTHTGFVLWDSDFLPEETKGADIVINAYSTNDMHVLTALQAKEGNQTLRDKVLQMTQDFVRSVLKDGSCAPLLLHMDDYLGNEQREVLVTTELSQATMVLANYYGFTSISYANVVRDIVYGDTHEYWISPKGWYENEQSDAMIREIHPGMGMHIISSWVAAYNMLHLALSFCSIESFWNATTVVDHDAVRPYRAIHGLPELRGNPIIPGKPKGRPAGLPPPLVDSLSLENITSAWKAATPMGRICPGMGVASVSDRCPFSWFSGLSKQGQNETYARDLFSTNNAYVEENTGWDINTAGKKLGISPTAKTKQALLKFNFEGTKVTRITFFYMKSYGEQWENSTIALTVMAMTNGSEFELLKRDELGGVHEKYTSETYTHSIDLMASSSSSSSMMLRNGKVTTVQVTIQHLRGQTFKIMGLAICE
jgi:hypothetical protein